MNLAFLLILILPQSFPSSELTAWMRPDAFRIAIGMDQGEAEARLDGSGWKIREGNEPGHLILDYDENRSLTLVIQDGVVESARFELVDFIPKLQKAFDEQRTTLAERFGEPDQSGGGLLIYDQVSPNVYVVLSTRPDSSFGRQGIGFLAVRYFDPPS